MSRCPSISELEDALKKPPGGEVSAHIEACARCRARTERLRKNQDLLSVVRGVGARQLSGAMDGRAPTVIDRPQGLAGYEITGEIYRGGQGVVYKALQKATKRTVAIKVVLRGAFATRRQRNRFEREIEIAARLRHPNIVTIHESGVTSDGSHYFVMEYVAGSALDVYWRTFEASIGRSAELSEKLRLFCKICDAVNAAHQRGIIHRDLKPANILIDAGGEPRVLDFGLAKAVGVEICGGDESAQTRTGEFMGTFSYAAPEQVRGDPDLVDTRTDVYALGVILYQTLTGKFPYAVDGSLSAVLRNITEAEPELPSAHSSEVGDELNTIVLKALSKERERRYQSAAALRRDVESFISGEPIDAKRDSRWYVLRKTARRYRVGLGVAGVFVVLASAFGVSMAVSARRTARERDRAQAAERSSERNARQLAAALSESRIQQGNTLSAAGNVSSAEELIWREFFEAPTADAGSDRIDPRHSERRRAYWALWELYSSAPCQRTWRMGNPPHCQGDMDRDARVLMSVGFGGPLRFWDVATAKVLSSQPLNAPDQAAVLMAPLGNAAAVMDGPETLHIYELDPNSGISRSLRSMKTPDRGFSRVAFSPDARALAVAFHSNSVFIWDDLRSDASRSLGTAPSIVTSLQFNRNGALIATGLYNGSVTLQDARAKVNSAARWTITAHTAPVRYISFSPDDTEMATAGGDNDSTVRLWEAASGRIIRAFSGHMSYVNSVVFSPDAGRLISGGSDRTVRIWDARTGDPLACYGGHDGPVMHVRCLGDGAGVASIGNDLTAKVWDAAPNGELRRFPDQKLTVMSVCVTRDGGTIYSAGSDGTIHERDASSGENRASFTGHGGAVSAVCLSPDGRRLASASYDRTVREWDTSSRKMLREYRGFDYSVLCAAYHPGGRLLGTGSDDGTVRIWDTANGTCLRVIHNPSDSKRRPSIAFSPDGATLAACEGRSSIVLYDPETGIKWATLNGHRGQVRCVAYSPDGSLLASAGDDAVVNLWNAKTGAHVATLEGHTDDVFGVAFSHDGEMLASGGRGRQIKLWDTATRRCLATLPGHLGMVFAVAFSPDDRKLFSGSADGTLGIWDLGYFERHIAGNLEYELARIADLRADPKSIADLRSWASETLARPQ